MLKTRNRVFRLSALSAAISSLSILAAPAVVHAQPSMLEEVIVTANRREESLQSVPLAVTASSGEMMQAQGIVDIKGISERTPGFTMGTFNPGQPQLYIRGIGSNEDGAGGDQSVIVFIDEVYIGRAAGMEVDLFDLERVEVLRGPQGTLFGKNVVGGAVNMITTKPSEETDLAVEASYGNYEALTLRGRASGQLSDGVFGKVSFSTRRRDGYFESDIGNYAEFFPNGYDGADALDVHSDSMRAALRFLPSDNLEVNITGSYAKVDKEGQPEYYFAPEGINPGYSYTVNNALINNYKDEIHKGIYDDPGFFESESWSLTGRVDYDMGDMRLTSLTSFRNVEAENQDIIGSLTSSGGTGTGLNALWSTVLPPGTVILYGDNAYEDESDTFTQELRLTSTGDGPLQWVAGLYFMTEETDRIESLGIGVDVALGPGIVLGAVPRIPGSDDQHNETTSYAGFGQLTYDFTDQLSLTVGARYTWEEKEISRVGIGDPLGLVGTFVVDTDENWDELTKKASLDYQMTDDVFFYLSYSEGFKSGGYQGTASNELAASTPFEPEFATLYEFGAKTQWFDNRVRLNAALFYTEYEDLQILQALVPEDAPQGAPSVLVTQNASDAEVQGLELELSASPVDGLTIQGSAAWLDTQYENFGVPAGYRPPVQGAGPSRDGNELRNAPDLAWNILVRYDWELSNGGGLAAQVDWRHKDLVWQDPDNFEVAAVPEYDVGDFRLIYTTPEGNVRVTGWVTNFTDEEYFLHNYPLNNTGFATPAAPRMYGLTVSWENL